MEIIKKILKNRIFYLGILLVFALGLIVTRLYDLQVKQKDLHTSDARKYVEYSLPLDAPRGNIYDRNGVLLATNRTSYKLYMVNTDDDQDYRDKMYLELVKLMEKNNDVYYNYLADYITYPLAWGVKIDGDDKFPEKKAWINSIVTTKSDKAFFDTPENAFNFLRFNIFEIDEAYTQEEAYKIMIMRYSNYMYGLDSLKPTLVATDVSRATVDELSARSQNFNGITSEETYFRVYVNNTTLGAVIGYVRAVSEDEYKELKDKGYYQSDVIGKIGIEKYCEDQLRGIRGSRTYTRSINGELTEVGYEAPVAGNDVYLTIDLSLQLDTYSSVERNVSRVAGRKDGGSNHGDCDAGAAVVSDVNSGEILAMVTYPTFDNSVFSARANDTAAQAKIQELLNDKGSSSINRTTQGTYPVGSLIKPAVAVAGLETGVVDKYSIVQCPGYIIASGRKMKCLGVHGKVSLDGALGHSCNTYFATIGLRTGIDTIDKWIKAFGLGESTGIELDERIGFRSNPATMDVFEAGNYHKWSDASTSATCIGQLYTTFSPLQVNRYYAALANGGKLNTMHLIQKIVSQSGEVVFQTENVQTPVGASKHTMDTVRNSLKLVVDNYPDLQSYLTTYPKNFIAGKTGTAQTGTNEESSHAFYSCYAPSDNPQIATTLLLEHGAYSGNNFYTVGDIFDSYFGGSYKTGKIYGREFYSASSIVTSYNNG